MRLEIKDLQSGKLHHVDERGAFVGSDPARAGIPASGASVAPVHARLFVKDGRWFIEDLATGGGTQVAGAKIKGAVELRAGAAFAVAGHRFQVTKTDGESVDDLQALLAEIDGQVGAGAAGSSKAAAAPTPRAAPRSTAGTPAATSRSPVQPGSSLPIEIPSPPAVAPPAKGPSAVGGGGGGVTPTAAAARAPAAARGTTRESGRPVATAAKASAGASPRPADEAGKAPAPSGAPAPAEPPADRAPPSTGGEGERQRLDAQLVSAPDDADLGRVASSFLTSVTLAARRHGRAAWALVVGPRLTLRAGVVDPPLAALGGAALVPFGLSPAVAVSTAVSVSSALAGGGSVVAVVGAAVLGLLAGVVAGVAVAIVWHPLAELAIRLVGGASDARLRTNAFVAQGAALLVVAAATLAGGVVSLVPVRGATAAPAVLGLGAAGLLLATWRAWGARFGLGRAFDGLLVACGLLAVAGTSRAIYLAVVRPPPSLGAAARVDAELEEAAARLSAIQGRLASREREPPTAPGRSRATARSSLDEYHRRRAEIDRAVRSDPALFERVDGLARLYAKLQRDTERIEKELTMKSRRRAPSERQRALALQARTAAAVDQIYNLLARR